MERSLSIAAGKREDVRREEAECILPMQRSAGNGRRRRRLPPSTACDHGGAPFKWADGRAEGFAHGVPRRAHPGRGARDPPPKEAPRCERSEHYNAWRRMGFPPWDSLCGGGASEEGFQGGKPRRGRRGTPCAPRPGRAGVTHDAAERRLRKTRPRRG